MFTLLIIDTKQLHKNVNTYVKSYISKKRLNRRREFIYICLYSVIPEFHCTQHWLTYKYDIEILQCIYFFQNRLMEIRAKMV